MSSVRRLRLCASAWSYPRSRNTLPLPRVTFNFPLGSGDEDFELLQVRLRDAPNLPRNTRWRNGRRRNERKLEMHARRRKCFA
jgi:hypothetical protein